jgi:hypothetical protein
VLPESDQADMAFFIEQVRIILPVLGFDFLRDPATSHTTLSQEENTLFEMELPTFGVKAQAQEIDGSFVVLQGSKTRPKWTAKNSGYGNLYDQLVKDEVLGDEADGKRLFTKDYEFNSPSAAAAIVAGRNINGRSKWMMKGSQLSYGDWQSEKLDQETKKGEP